jgi:arylsulfatase
MAQVLKERGYRTACIGKWHLGCRPAFMPTSRGFDEFFGLPYSNDMWPLPLLMNTEVIEDPARLDMLALRFAEQAARFITRSKDAPFLLYYATVSSHIPLIPPKQFRGRSHFGLYGDVVQTLDWCVGEVLRALRENGLEENTLVLFSSDNGPWYQGSAGPLRGRKGETYEGGVRVPFLARYTGSIPAGRVCQGVASALDVLPTLARLAGAGPPANPLDGLDIWPLLAGEREAVDRDLLLFFDQWNLQCARSGPWKLHVSRYNSFAWGPAPAAGRLNLPLPRPELYNLEADPEESYDVAGDYPEVVAAIRARMEEKLLSFPAQVALEWNHTMSRPVEDTPSGALPILKSGG